MSYIVLARKYRPQSFKEVVGQAHVCRILENSISSDRIGHAYLFSGQRGIGKTTIARIFAKALNCKKGPTPEPCEKCTNCTEITEGNSVDVLEIDAASNRGIDEIRAIRENVKFAAASSKFKIYIIDEAHQITGHAFNALLKTLEEPPEHVVFMMATTEPQSIPVTILSRCQKFSLKPIPTQDIVKQLEGIVKKEKFGIEKDAVNMVAQLAGGSMRDSLSLLDQVVSISPGKKVSAGTVRELLGLSPMELVSSYIETIVKKDARGILEIITGVAGRGYDFVQFSRDLREYIRKLIFVSLDRDGTLSGDMIPEDRKLLEKQKGILSVNELLRMLRLLNRCVYEIRWSDNPRLVFELYSLRMVQPVADIDSLIQRLERIEQGGGGEVPGIDDVQSPYSDDNPVAAGSPREETGSDPSFSGKWRNVINEVRKKKPLTAPVLEAAPVKLDSPGEVAVTLPGGMTLNRIKNASKLIEGIMSEVFGSPMKLVCREGSGKDKKGGDNVAEDSQEELSEDAPAEAYELEDTGRRKEEEGSVDVGINKVIKGFSGKLVK